MDIRTKVISTIIAMVCSISVSATGIVAILLEFPISVANTTTIQASDVQGDLYGERYGADGEDLIAQHLYKYGVGVQEDTLNYFCKDVSFSLGSKEIEYVFKFVFASDADSATFITLEDAAITNEACYTQSYKIAYGQARPDWSGAEDITLGKTYVSDSENPYVWLRATLSIRKDAYQRLDTAATWSFIFNFEGAATTQN